MGFMDKLKSIKNAITGGSADVSLEIGEASLGGSTPVRITAVIGDADLKIDKVYLKVRSRESVFVRNIPVAVERSDYVDVRRQDVEQDIDLYKERHEISGKEVLNANETYTWEGELTLPSDAKASYYGEQAKHVWEAFAGLDAFGNDPDSGWVEFEAY